MNNKQWNSIWVNGLLVTLNQANEYGLIEKGALAVANGQIAWVGAMAELPADAALLADQVIDLKGKCVTPGLVDCHTHLVYAGSRSHEFALRLKGVTYEEIARQGGGIQSTVTATRQASEDELLQQSLPRARALHRSGVTTLEIKSGYGLDLATELKILRVANRIAEALPVTVRKTFLGAHTVPSEFRGRADDYIAYVCEEMLPEIAQQKLADYVDVFCEKIAFNLEQTERVFQAAQKFKLGIKCHSEQLSDLGCARLAASFGALSVDHLEYLSEPGVAALAEAGTVAVLLPGAFYFLREKQLPPIDLLRRYAVPMAIASDCNPGTSPATSLLLMMNMACTLFRMTPEEALLGVTKHAAAALGLADRCGTLTVGKEADFVVFDCQHPDELAYHIGMNSVAQIVKGGVVVS